jgi:arginase family enzyme
VSRLRAKCPYCRTFTAVARGPETEAVAPGNVALVGARDLDPPEREFIAACGIHIGGAEAVECALDGTEGRYVAIDSAAWTRTRCTFMPVPGGLTVASAERLLDAVALRRSSPAPVSAA